MICRLEKYTKRSFFNITESDVKIVPIFRLWKGEEESHRLVRKYSGELYDFLPLYEEERTSGVTISG